MTRGVVALSFVFLFVSVQAQDKGTGNLLTLGEDAPDFSLPYATKDSVASEHLSLSSAIGRNVIVLAFYPADWSGGCTKEMCAMRDNITDLSHLSAEVLGISGDYVYSHHEWAKYLNLPIKLVSDHLHAVAKMYDSYNAQSGFNNRTVYVIDKQGKIRYIDLSYSSRDMKSFEKLKAALETIH